MSRRHALPTRRQIDALIGLLPGLESPAEEFATSEFGENSYTVWNSPAVTNLETTLYENAFVLRDFDWTASPELERRSGDRRWIARATLAELCELFTAHVRKDRFCGGHLASMCRDGHIQAMLGRLKQFDGIRSPQR